MHDGFVMRGFEGVSNLPRDIEGFFERNRSLRDVLRQRRPFDQLHHEVVWPDVVKRADVGMIQRRNRAGLSLKAIGELLGRNLDGDVAIQSWVARLPHLAHATLAETRDDLVRSEARGCWSGHVNP